MDTIKQIFSDFQMMATILAGLSGISAIVITIIFIFKPREGLAIKLLGSLMVLSILFGANNPWIYGVGTFIIATLVTELQFLEKLAALAWNRNKYWDYLKETATEGEKKAKILEQLNSANKYSEPNPDDSENDQQENDLSKSIKNVKDYMDKTMEFKKDVISEIRSNKEFLFGKSNIIESAKLTGYNTGTIIDLIVESSDVHYLIEINVKKELDGDPTLDWESAMIYGTYTAYKNYLMKKNINVDVRPIIVIPADSYKYSEANNFGLVAPNRKKREDDYKVKSFPVLRFDEKLKKFSNLKEVKDIIDNR